MPSNKNLIESISKVATEKGVEIPNTVGLNNDQLNKALKELRALEVKPAETPDEDAEKTSESTEESENLTPGSEDSTDATPDEDAKKTSESTEVKPDPEAEEKLRKEAEEKAQKLKDAKLKAEKDKRAEEKAAIKAKQDAIPPYRVADGKAITCKKGVLSDGDEVKVEYLPGGKETLDNLVDRGFVIKK